MDLTILDPELAARVAGLVEASTPASTRRAYASDLADWATWAEERGFEPVPADPAAVAGYLADCSDRGLKLSSIERRAAAIAVANRAVGAPSPRQHLVVRKVLAGLRRTMPTDVARKKPVRLAELVAMLETLRPGLTGLRDRCLLLVGYAAALRRSELAGIDLDHLARHDRGLVLTIPRSKTDQRGDGVALALPYGSRELTCPVSAVHDWVEAAEITEGPLLRRVDRHGNVGADRLSDRTVAEVVKRAARAAGLEDPDAYGGHSLRSGLVTEAATRGAPERAIARTTRHRSLSVLREYVRHDDAFEDVAVTAAGL